MTSSEAWMRESDSAGAQWRGAGMLLRRPLSRLWSMARELAGVRGQRSVGASVIGGGVAMTPHDAPHGSLHCDPAEIIALVTMATAAGASVWVRANSNSMAPAIRFGTDVRLDAPGDVAVDGVVLAPLTDGRLVLHRVVAIEGDRVLLRGDAAGVSDPPISRSAVLARADVLAIGSRIQVIGPLRTVRLVRLRRLLRPLRRMGRWIVAGMRSGWMAR